MKKCPTCQQVFDGSNDFCPDDGTALVAPHGSPFDTPTQVFQTPTSAGYPATGKSTSPILYLVIGVLAAGFVAALIFIFAMPGRMDDAKKAENTNAVVKGELPAKAATPLASDNTADNIPPPISDPTLTPTGTWSGDWAHDKNTSAFTARAELTETGGRVEGRIVWTLVRSSNPQKLNKSGLTAVEYVRGTFDPQTRLVKVRGYRKDDPNNLVIYDAYNLSLSADNRSLSGRSKNGAFRLRR